MSRPPRLTSIDYRGGWRYLLTACTTQRTRVFRDADVVDLVWDQFRYTSEREHCEIVAFCFMPDHVHMLVTGGTEDADFRRFARLAKQRAGWRYQRRFGHALWQEGYHERVLRSDEATPVVAAYILGNPIRGGLVQAVEDYPFWGSGIHTREELLDYVGALYVGRTS